MVQAAANGSSPPLLSEGAAFLILSSIAKGLEHTVEYLGFFTFLQVSWGDCTFATNALQNLGAPIIWHRLKMALSGKLAGVTHIERPCFALFVGKRAGIAFNADSVLSGMWRLCGLAIANASVTAGAKDITGTGATSRPFTRIRCLKFFVSGNRASYPEKPKC